jgi:pimeloyl-ACP methyl ester carboxylesterase
MFRRLIDLLADEFRVIAPDYPGFGHKEGVPDSFWAPPRAMWADPSAHPYGKDLPNAEIIILDTGHFALEDHADVIARHISRFTATLS